MRARGAKQTSPYSTTANSKEITGLTAGRSYTFQIRARNADVEGAYTQEITVVTPPKAPTSVTATSTGDSVTVNWNKVAGAIGYLIRLNTDEVYGLENTTSTTYSGLKPKTTYTYQVASRSLDGVGSFSAAKTIKTLAKMPDVPSGILGQTTENSVTVKWDAVSGATGYDIQFNGSTYSTTSPSRTFTGLKDNTEYAYRVRSKNADGVSEYGPEKKVRTTPKAPDNPTASSDESSVTVSWAPVTGASSYDLEIDGKVYNVTGTSHRVTGLQDDTGYRYRIRSVNEGGYSSYSSYMTVKTALKAPDVPTDIRFSTSSTSVTVSWKYMSKAKSYDLLFNGTVYNTTGTSKTVSGLRPETTYTQPDYLDRQRRACMEL